MSATVEDYVRQARAEATPGHGRIVAMWAGIVAARSAVSVACPFNANESDLVDGFERGLAMASRRPAAVSPSLAMRPRAGTYAAYSVPKDEED